MLKNILFSKTKLKRTTLFALTDGVIIALSLFLSFYLRFEGEIPGPYLNSLPELLCLFLAVKYSVFIFFRMYRMTWSYVGFYEFLDILKAAVSGSIILYGIIFLLQPGFAAKFPRSVIPLDFAFSMLFISMFRVSKRFFKQVRKKKPVKAQIRTLIIGAGHTGEQIARDMRRQENSPYLPVGFIDDDFMKQGYYIQGIKVYGGRKDIINIVEKLNIKMILLAIPSAPSADIREVLSIARSSSAGIVKTLPGLVGTADRKYSLSDIQDIRIEDILGREQVSINTETVSSFIRGRKVLITGAGGSIGSELVRQVIAFSPGKVIALDIDETELHRIELELKSRAEHTLVTVLADITDREKIKLIFSEHRPDAVFHAAAYKHVFMMERHPEEAVRVNVMGTRNVAEAALEYETEKFILVSTDKAVRPANIMGATKRVAEEIIGALNSLQGTKYSSVRFGNVVGSRGSVIPIFEEQIRKGGPVTVTHRDMRRYFMSIPEACTLILQSASIGKGGEVFILDMGEQIKILDIAREMIRLNGLEPEVDIPIVFTGAKPGEKLYEELLTDTEDVELTCHPKIFMSRNRGINSIENLKKIELLNEVTAKKNWGWIKGLLSDIVPSYTPSEEPANVLNECEVGISSKLNSQMSF